MKTTEKEDYQRFKKNVFRPLDRVDRVENILVPGTFDVNYCIEGVEGWVELKSPVEPKRPGTSLFGSNHKLSMDQKNWALRQTNAKGRSFILIASDKRWMLIEGKFADELNTSTVERLLKISRWACDLPIRKEHWCGLRAALKDDIEGII